MGNWSYNPTYTHLQLIGVHLVGTCVVGFLRQKYKLPLQTTLCALEIHYSCLLMEQILHQLLSFMKPYQKMGYSDILHINRISCINLSVCAVENPLQSWPLHRLQPWKSAEFWDLHQGWRVIYFERPPKTYHSLRALGPPLMPFVISFFVPHFLEESCLKICAPRFQNHEVPKMFTAFLPLS